MVDVRLNSGRCAEPPTLNAGLYLCAMKILMVCLGNICRSPLAEGILQQKVKEAGLNWIIDSAGTNGYHVGEAPHHLSQKVAKQNGVDISCQAARKFVTEDFEHYDRIYAMANDVMEDMRRIAKHKFDSNKARFFLDELLDAPAKDVPDPWYGDEDGYHEVFTLIDQTCDALVKRFFATQHPQTTT